MAEQPPEVPEDSSQPQMLRLNLSQKIGDVQIHFRGLSRTSPSTLYPDLKGIKAANTVQELFTLLDEAHWRLSKLGLFNSVHANLRRGNRRGDVDVVFEFEEKPPSYSIGVATNQKTEANFEVKGEVPGIFGTCNSLSLELNKSGYGSQNISVSYLMPRNIGFPNFTSVFQVFTSQTDFTNYSSFSTNTKGISLAFFDINKRHQAVWEASMSDLYPSFNENRRASFTVLRHSGRSLKNSISYQYTLDALQGDSIPVKGQCTQVKLEAGLPGGDRQFLKIDYNMLYALLMRNKLIMHVNLSMGYIRPYGSLSSSSNLLDRFHSTGKGGAGLSFRGFGYRGVGPCDYASILDSDTKKWRRIPEHTGGDCYGNIQLALHYPIQYKHYRMPLTFCFMNLGSLISREDNKPQESIYSQVLREMRMSVGVGFSMGMAKGCWLEAFVAQPLLYSPSDTINLMQVGFRFKHNIT